MRVIGVGDNTVDCYLHLGMMFPGGNSVNVPVHTQRFGHPSSYIGCLADDTFGNLIKNALVEEGVDISRSKVLEGKNAFCEISLQEGDRVFGNSSAGVSKHLTLDNADLDFIAEHDHTHTSVYSSIEDKLEKLRAVSKTLSFDFSQDWDRSYLERILPFVDFALVSNPEVEQAINKELMLWAASQGVKVILVTMGEHGALLYDGKQFYHQAVVPINPVVDTLGAGDAFVARFLVDYLSGLPPQQALENAAKSAAETCGYYGAFGHGKPFVARDSFEAH